MHSKLVATGSALRTFMLVLDTDDEACEAIKAFAKSEGLTGASFTALGAFQHAKVAWFDLHAKTYRAILINEQCEVLNLTGDIAMADDGEPSVHAHAVLGRRDGSTCGGHLMEGHVRPTLEVFVSVFSEQLRRIKRPELGLALIDLAK